MAMYSRSHCLTRIPKEAVTRLQTRLENQRVLTRTELEVGLNDTAEVRMGGRVAFTNVGLTEKLLSC